MTLPLQSQLPVVGVTPEGLATLLIAAAAGGAFGAALGALPSFAFTGFVVFLGEGASDPGTPARRA